jgi:hypothetical protein
LGPERESYSNAHQEQMLQNFFSWHWHLGILAFDVLAFWPSGISAIWHFSHLAFRPSGIFSIWHFFHLALCPSGILSIRPFIHQAIFKAFWPSGILTEWHFGLVLSLPSVIFWPFGISALSHLGFRKYILTFWHSDIISLIASHIKADTNKNCNGNLL